MPGFRILRYFSATSFVFVAIAALALALMYRFIAINGIVHLGERANVTLAQMALNTLRPQLISYLNAVADPAQVTAQYRRGKQLEGEIFAAMHETTVQRIKIYNTRGIVAYSTKGEQTGRDQSGNPGVQAAMQGRIASKLVYRDSFNVFDATTEDDNLIQTYVPVRAGPTEPIVGVFEIYTDVNAMVNETERTEVLVMLGAATVLLLLYGAMLIIVRRAESVIESQQGIIRERTHTLELLAAKLLTAQESEKKRIAGGLHEGIAQTLAAVKAHLENAPARSGKTARGAAAKNAALIDLVQSAIQEVRSLATDLRPASLDDLGVAATIDWFCRRFQTAHPEIRVDVDPEIDAANVSVSLGVIIYRILQEAMEAIARTGRASRIRVALGRRGDVVVLAIEDDSLPPARGDSDTERRVALAALQERATLSGGKFQELARPRGGSLIQVSWPV